MQDKISVWESEGGHTFDSSETGMRGTVNQIAWASQIKTQVDAEFDRVANGLRTAAAKRSNQLRTDVEGMIAILEDKRAEVLANQEAGYFIHDWQELRDQVRQMIMKDPRYDTIRAARL